MDIQGPVITTYVYQLIDNDVRVEKVEFRKDPEPIKAQEAPRTVLPQAIPQSPAVGGGW